MCEINLVEIEVTVCVLCSFGSAYGPVADSYEPSGSMAGGIILYCVVSLTSLVPRIRQGDWEGSDPFYALICSLKRGEVPALAPN
jgi:hypothetical protein